MPGELLFFQQALNNERSGKVASTLKHEVKANRPMLALLGTSMAVDGLSGNGIHFTDAYAFDF